MKILKMSLLPALLFALAGCSQPSYPEMRINDSQKVMSSASQWRILADHTANRIIDYLQGTVLPSGEPRRGEFTTPAAVKPLYVMPADPGMLFSRAFNDDLKAAILNRGWALSNSPEDAYVVAYRVEMIKRDGNVPLESFPGIFSMIGFGYFVIEDLVVRDPLLLGLGAALDMYKGAITQGGAQLQITTALYDGDINLLRVANAYYINDPDFKHYVGNFPQGAYVAPRPADPTPPGVKTLAVEAD